MTVPDRPPLRPAPRRRPTSLHLAGLGRAVAEEKARRWREENREALLACNARVGEHGLPLARYRRFSTCGTSGSRAAR